MRFVRHLCFIITVSFLSIAKLNQFHLTWDNLKMDRNFIYGGLIFSFVSAVPALVRVLFYVLITRVFGF